MEIYTHPLNFSVHICKNTHSRNLSVYTCKHIHTHAILVYIYVNIYTYVWTYLHIFTLRLRVWVYMCIYADYVWVYIYTSTHGEDGDLGGIYVDASFLFQYGVPVVCHPLSTFVCQRKYWCVFVRVVGERRRNHHLCSLGGVSRQC